jgi:hypothetical protein
MGREARRNKDKWRERPTVLDQVRPGAQTDPEKPKTVRANPRLGASMAVLAALAMMSGGRGPTR